MLGKRIGYEDWKQLHCKAYVSSLGQIRRGPMRHAGLLVHSMLCVLSQHSVSQHSVSQHSVSHHSVAPLVPQLMTFLLLAPPPCPTAFSKLFSMYSVSSNTTIFLITTTILTVTLTLTV